MLICSSTSSRLIILWMLSSQALIKNIDGPPVMYGEFICWIGCWFIMATVSGPQRTEYWRNSDINIFEGAPFRLNDIMTGNRFKAILSSLEYNNKPPPEYKDRFWMI
jgi:Transposase IS4